MLPYIRVTKQAESVMGIGGTGINILDRVGGGDAFASGLIYAMLHDYKAIPVRCDSERSGSEAAPR